jgi:hypothetical protein
VDETEVVRRILHVDDEEEGLAGEDVLFWVAMEELTS